MGAEVIARQVGKAELFFRGELPGHLQLNALAATLRLGHEFGRRRLLKLDQHGGGLDLDPLAAVQFHLRRGIGL